MHNVLRALYLLPRFRVLQGLLHKVQLTKMAPRASLANQSSPSLCQVKHHNLGPCKISETQNNQKQKWDHRRWPPHQIVSPPSPHYHLHLQHLSGLLTILLSGTHHSVHVCALQSSIVGHFLTLCTLPNKISVNSSNILRNHHEVSWSLLNQRTRRFRSILACPICQKVTTVSTGSSRLMASLQVIVINSLLGHAGLYIL